MKNSFLFCLPNRKLFALTWFVLLMAGCARTTPIIYYQISTIAAEKSVGELSGSEDLVIGLGPVTLPEFLDRPLIVTHSDPNRLQLSDSHRWVEPLGSNFTRVVRDNLSKLLKTENFIIYPWSKTTHIDYQIVIELARFEGENDKTALLEAVWSIRDNKGNSILSPRRSTKRITTTNSDYQALVEGLSRASTLLCHEIASEIKKQRTDPPSPLNNPGRKPTTTN